MLKLILAGTPHNYSLPSKIQIDTSLLKVNIAVLLKYKILEVDSTYVC